MNKTVVKTSYPDLVDTYVANSTEFVKKYSNYLASIGAVSTGAATPETKSNQLLLNNKSSVNPDGSYEFDARITFYSPDEPKSDVYTKQRLGSQSSIYGPLSQGTSVAVDKNIVPYGSNVVIPGLGTSFIAMDTGSAVISRQASRNTGGQPVIDVFVESYAEQLRLSRSFDPVVRVKVYSNTDTQKIFAQNKDTFDSVELIKENNRDLELPLSIAIDYHNSVKSGNPVSKIPQFFNQIESNKLSELDNEYVFYWYKKLNSLSDVIKQQVAINEDNFLANPSDSVGILANQNSKYDDSVSPLFDYKCDFGAPNIIPVSVKSKLSPTALALCEEMSLKNSSLMKSNLINIQRTSDATNMAIDSTTSHGLNLVTDLNFYLSVNTTVLNQYVEKLKSTFNRTYTYVNYFSNINEQRAYNPRNYNANNLQQIYNIQYDANVENTVQSFDVMHKQVVESRSSRTIEKVLGTETSTNEAPAVTTDSLNQKFLNVRRNYDIIKSPVSLTQGAQAELSAALNSIKIPNANLTFLDNVVNKVGVIPGFSQSLPGFSQLTQPIFAPIKLLSDSVTDLQKLASAPLLNIPKVLPSVDPGSFPQILELSQAVIALKDPATGRIDVGSALNTIEQAKNILCDFKLPIIGKVDFSQILDMDIDFDFESFQKKLRALLPKFPTEKDLEKFFKNLLPNFKQLFKDLYDKFFTCNNKNDY